ncbi:hypothetical protein PRNP1_012259 [Phytophthora ramorum]
MFRPNWDVVSPFTWLDSLADEEEFIRGFDKRSPSTRFVIIPHSHQRGRNDEPMTEQAQEEQEEEEEEMETEDSPAAEEQKLMAGNFFDDLPVGAKLMGTQVPANVAPPLSKTKEGYSFFTYSYSTCLTADDNGRRVNSTRRRYEDSTGPAEGAAQAPDRHVCARVDVEARAWKKTPFGVAEEQAKAHGAKQQSVLPDQPPAQELP